MPDIQQLPAFTKGRPETGPMQFGDDWPGVFIRGDNACYYAHMLKLLLKHGEAVSFEQATLKGLISVLEGCRVTPA